MITAVIHCNTQNAATKKPSMTLATRRRYTIRVLCPRHDVGDVTMPYGILACCPPGGTSRQAGSVQGNDKPTIKMCFEPATAQTLTINTTIKMKSDRMPEEVVADKYGKS